MIRMVMVMVRMVCNGKNGDSCDGDGGENEEIPTCNSGDCDGDEYDGDGDGDDEIPTCRRHGYSSDSPSQEITVIIDFIIEFFIYCYIFSSFYH